VRHSLFAFPVIGSAASSRSSSPDIVSGLNLLEADAVLVGVVKPGLRRLESGGARPPFKCDRVRTPLAGASVMSVWAGVNTGCGIGGRGGRETEEPAHQELRDAEAGDGPADAMPQEENLFPLAGVEGALA
jgi:hypothetical protein